MQRVFRASAFAIVVLVLLASCKSKEKQGSFEVSGVIHNTGAKYIYLERLPMLQAERIIEDSAKLGSDGSYKLRAKNSEQTVYNLRLDQNQYPMASVINDAASVTVNASYKEKTAILPETYEVSGSKASQQLKDFVIPFNTDLQHIYQLSMTGDSMQKAKMPDSLLNPLVSEITGVTKGLRARSLQAMNEFANPALTMFELGIYQTTSHNPAFGLEPLTDGELETIVNGLVARFPNHEGIAAVKNFMKMKSGESQQQQQATGSWVGKNAPDFTLPDVAGKQVSLSSFKGKYVLVDFWASWCQPCRYENPNVVKAWQKYKGKNFAILGVSLDEDKAAWQKAIKEDQLAWTHVSELKGWESNVVSVYGFGEVGIPYNILLDPSGKVIAERLRGEALDAKLGELLQ